MKEDPLCRGQGKSEGGTGPCLSSSGCVILPNPCRSAGSYVLSTPQHTHIHPYTHPPHTHTLYSCGKQISYKPQPEVISLMGRGFCLCLQWTSFCPVTITRWGWAGMLPGWTLSSPRTALNLTLQPSLLHPFQSERHQEHSSDLRRKFHFPS